MTYRPWIEVNILQKALEIAAEQVLREHGSDSLLVPTTVRIWIDEARHFYKAQAQLKACKTTEGVTS